MSLQSCSLVTTSQTLSLAGFSVAATFELQTTSVSVAAALSSAWLGGASIAMQGAISLSSFAISASLNAGVLTLLGFGVTSGSVRIDAIDQTGFALDLSLGLGILGRFRFTGTMSSTCMSVSAVSTGGVNAYELVLSLKAAIRHVVSQGNSLLESTVDAILEASTAMFGVTDISVTYATSGCTSATSRLDLGLSLNSQTLRLPFDCTLVAPLSSAASIGTCIRNAFTRSSLLTISGR